MLELFRRVPFAYVKTTTIYRQLEKKQPGSGGLFAIMVSDLCKGCGECVVECGEHRALVMATETEELNADHVSVTNFLHLLADPPPSRARDVIAEGESLTFIVHEFDEERRGIDLGLLRRDQKAQKNPAKKSGSTKTAAEKSAAKKSATKPTGQSRGRRTAKRSTSRR